MRLQLPRRRRRRRQHRPTSNRQQRCLKLRSCDFTGPQFFWRRERRDGAGRYGAPPRGQWRLQGESEAVWLKVVCRPCCGGSSRGCLLATGRPDFGIGSELRVRLGACREAGLSLSAWSGTAPSSSLCTGQSLDKFERPQMTRPAGSREDGTCGPCWCLHPDRPEGSATGMLREG